MITFDEKTHIYRLGETVLPSVTTVIREAGLMDATFWNSEACNRGTRVAKMTAYLDQGDLDESTVDPAELGYLNAWRRFLSESGFEVGGVEQLVYMADRAAGTLDRIGLLNSVSAIIDIKTGQASAWHAVQTAGYSMLSGRRHRRYACYLGDDGTYKLVQHADHNDFGVFDSCVNLHWWKRRNMK